MKMGWVEDSTCTPRQRRLTGVGTAGVTGRSGNFAISLTLLHATSQRRYKQALIAGDGK